MGVLGSAVVAPWQRLPSSNVTLFMNIQHYIEYLFIYSCIFQKSFCYNYWIFLDKQGLFGGFPKNGLPE